MEVVIALAVVGAFAWKVHVWLNKRLRKIDKKLRRHDAADKKLKKSVKTLCSDMETGFAKVNEDVGALKADMDEIKAHLLGGAALN